MGDLYNPHVHPSLVRVAQLFGCMVWQETNHTTSLATIEAFELEATLSLLTPDVPPLTQLQVHNVLGIYFFIRRMWAEGSEQVRLASEVAQRHDLRFASSPADLWNSLLELSAEDEERVCALSHLLYINIDRQLVLGIPSSLNVEYEQDFQSISVSFTGHHMLQPPLY